MKEILLDKESLDNEDQNESPSSYTASGLWSFPEKNTFTEKPYNTYKETQENAYDEILRKTTAEYVDVSELKNEMKALKEKSEKEFTKQEKIFKEQASILKSAVTDQKEQKRDLEKYKNKIIEIIGVFSSIIAFISINVAIVKSTPNFLAAILLIVALTASLSFFVVLIRSLFIDKEDIEKEAGIKKWQVWAPIITLIVLVILGGSFYFLEKDLYKNWNDKRQEEINNLKKELEDFKKQEIEKKLLEIKVHQDSDYTKVKEFEKTLKELKNN